MAAKPTAQLTLEKVKKSVSIFVGKDTMRPIVTVMELPNGCYQLLGRTADKEASRSDMRSIMRELGIKIAQAAEEL